MDFNYQVVGLVAVGFALAVMIAVRIPDMFEDKSHLNSTEDWASGPEQQENPPPLTRLTPHELRLITSRLEAGETLEGFARGFFVPPRLKDYRFGSGLEKVPLLIAATSRRILLFEVTIMIVHRYCFIPYEEIAFLDPPKPGMFGTSGRMRFGLRSGREYQMGFFGPLLSEEGMRHEQSLAAYFREIAPRFASSASHDSTPRAAA